MKSSDGCFHPLRMEVLARRLSLANLKISDTTDTHYSTSGSVMKKIMRSLVLDRKTYMKDIYAKYWIDARERIYGFPKYDKILCSYICENIPKGQNILEVGIGTGFPFADFLQKAGYALHGIDISETLIAKCRELNAKIYSMVGDAEDLPYQNAYFHCTYCFHSSWYFPNLCKAIDEMNRVTIPGGVIIFDIQNKNSKQIETAYRKRLSKSRGGRLLFTYAKNIVSILLGRGPQPWHNFTHEAPTDPETIYRHFQDRQIDNYEIMVKNRNDSLELRAEPNAFENFAKLVFVIRK